jgi:hypothetical protein
MLPPPPPPPERTAPDLALEDGLAEDAGELVDAEAAFPAALMVAVSAGNGTAEAVTALPVFAGIGTREIKGKLLDGEEETGETSMA